MTDVITIKEVAKILQVSKRTADSLSFRPDFPKAIRYTPRGKRFWNPESIEKWRDRQLAK